MNIHIIQSTISPIKFTPQENYSNSAVLHSPSHQSPVKCRLLPYDLQLVTTSNNETELVVILQLSSVKEVILHVIVQVILSLNHSHIRRASYSLYNTQLSNIIFIDFKFIFSEFIKHKFLFPSLLITQEKCFGPSDSQEESG